MHLKLIKNYYTFETVISFIIFYYLDPKERRKHFTYFYYLLQRIFFLWYNTIFILFSLYHVTNPMLPCTILWPEGLAISGASVPGYGPPSDCLLTKLEASALVYESGYYGEYLHENITMHNNLSRFYVKLILCKSIRKFRIFWKHFLGFIKLEFRRVDYFIYICFILPSVNVDYFSSLSIYFVIYDFYFYIISLNNRCLGFNESKLNSNLNSCFNNYTFNNHLEKQETITYTIDRKLIYFLWLTNKYS